MKVREQRVNRVDLQVYVYRYLVTPWLIVIISISEVNLLQSRGFLPIA
jgi:hypothetical protein